MKNLKPIANLNNKFKFKLDVNVLYNEFKQSEDYIYDCASRLSREFYRNYGLDLTLDFFDNSLANQEQYVFNENTNSWVDLRNYQNIPIEIQQLFKQYLNEFYSELEESEN